MSGDLTNSQTMRSRWLSVLAMATSSFRADRRRTIWSITLDIVVGLAGPVTAIGTGMLVDAVVRGAHLGRIVTAAVVLAVSGSTVLCLSLVADRLRIRLEENVAHFVELQVMGMVTGLRGIAHHENPAHLHRIDRLLEESWLVAMAVPALVESVQVVARFVLTIAALATVDSRLALLPLATMAALWAGVSAERIRLRALDQRSQVNRRAEDIFRLVGKTEAAAELRVFRSGEQLIARHATANAAVARDERRHRMQGGWRLAIGRSVFAAGFGVGMVAVARRAAAGSVSPGHLVMVIGLASQVIGQANSISAQLNWVNWTLTGARHYVWLLDYDAAHRGHDGPMLAAPDRLVSGVRFDDVSFAYPGTDKVVLDHLDLELAAGSVVAVVGDNGAGKTTLIKLLLRFYEPTAGTITIDGVPLSAIDPIEWRSRATAALQDHTRPELLVGEAITIGDLDNAHDDSALGLAASRSGADDVMAALPFGRDTQLGLEWPGGTELSGGQWQRVAVGRSAMRPDPLLLILDEPTAALDPVAEHALFEHYTGALNEARRARGAITVVISHRLSTVRAADLIVVVEGARVAEQGTHDELLAADGRYAKLFRIQASSYT